MSVIRGCVRFYPSNPLIYTSTSIYIALSRCHIMTSPLYILLYQRGLRSASFTMHQWSYTTMPGCTALCGYLCAGIYHALSIRMSVGASDVPMTTARCAAADSGPVLLAQLADEERAQKT